MTRFLFKGLFGSLLAVLLLWVLASLAVLPRYATRVPDNPVTDTPRSVGLNYRDIIVDSEGLALPGWWMPAREPVANLLFVHGAGSNRTSSFIDSLNLYKAFVDRGISVLTIDLRNHGNAPKTDGHLTMGLKEAADVLAMSRWLDEHTDPALPRVAMGASMGGATVIHALAQNLSLRAAILLDPALNTRDSMAQGAWVNTGLPVEIFHLYAWAATTFYSLPSGERDTAELASTIQTPTLLIQDPEDPVTRLPFAEALDADNPHISLAVAEPVATDAPCVSNKGRWGSHVAAFRCFPQWTFATIEAFLGEQRILLR